MGRKPAREKSSPFLMASNQFEADAGKKEIKASQIVSRVLSALELTPPINAKAKWSELGKGNLNAWDAALAIMAYDPFRRDGLEISKSVAINCDTLGELGDAIFTWYDDNGWTIG